MSGADYSLVRSIRGPVTLITLGVLFALNNFTPYGFHETWPVLLIVFGLLSLLRRAEPVRPRPYPGQGPYAPGPNVPPPVYQAPPASAQSGGYRQSQYGQPGETQAGSSGPAKGGFGASGAPAPPGQTPGGEK